MVASFRHTRNYLSALTYNGSNYTTTPSIKEAAIGYYSGLFT
ncbi:hypothetical protein NC652_035565 [Populus alba x Populus x berolinensis]|nr:hypothetical protein NC652_035563 [Populus alba x Populus x berolinensis]KAJ6876236.1 hypothetical protein NC652_035565 [Populus alba x Populus x berolinensis]